MPTYLNAFIKIPFFQIHTSDLEKKEAYLLSKRKRRLILHNKAPMWNEASQVIVTFFFLKNEKLS